MPPRIPSASEIKRAFRAIQADARGLATLRYLTLRIRPVKVGLVALAIAIFLWGFAYKISRFQVHRTTLSRVSAFRLWDESRHARAVADVLRKFQTEPTPAAAEALISLDSFPPRADERRIGFVAALLPTQPALASSLPSRAPPRPRCFLA